MGFCSNCLVYTPQKDLLTIDLIKSEYLKGDVPWYIGFSGGKDSSALLSLVINALIGLKEYPRKINIIFCDTGVENPILTNYVYKTFEDLKIECSILNIPISFIIAKPELKDRFFVKVIGKGYPTPTNIFRWCTQSLRINPVQKIIGNNKNAIILLGIRQGESNTRNSVINKHRLSESFYLKQNTSTKKIIFAPILHYDIKDVWSTLKFKNFPRSIQAEIIGKLYKDAGSECPIFSDAKGTPCGKGRFGCWTCTVVRKDKSTEKLIENGYDSLLPLLNFRNWISEFRDNLDYRCKERRNGFKGLGPITIQGRKIILTKLLELQKDTSLILIGMEEIELIYKYWQEDLNNKEYYENKLF